MADNNLPLIKVTQKMIQAGLDELNEHHHGDPWPYILEQVYRAMHYESMAAVEDDE